ncbi:MAG: hypothetical protein LBU08_02305, partial [Tannerellaceae bacterium]|jgi:hypothetical protein|nr:hypothetical protein [Tannerellaceae bacterium]
LETAELLRQVPATSDFINTFAKKVCIFSNRPKQTPEGMADAFFSFPEECFSEHWPPLSKFGFSFKETDIVQIN